MIEEVFVFLACEGLEIAQERDDGYAIFNALEMLSFLLSSPAVTSLKSGSTLFVKASPSWFLVGMHCLCWILVGYCCFAKVREYVVLNLQLYPAYRLNAMIRPRMIRTPLNSQQKNRPSPATCCLLSKLLGTAVIFKYRTRMI